MLPTKGRPLGPGGSGMEFFRRLNQIHTNIESMRIKKVLVVGLNDMVSARDNFFAT
jgi:hypothetical protein